MGALSGIARHIVAGLRDPAVRTAVATAMKTPAAGRLGLDLRRCDADAVVGNVLRSGEHQGGAPSTDVCKEIQAHDGLVLYMDPDRLRAWDGSTIPLVTAIADPNKGLPSSFHAYRGVHTLAAVPSDGSLRGPILVILPYRHTAEARGHANERGSQRTLHLAPLDSIIEPAPRLPAPSTTPE